MRKLLLGVGLAVLLSLGISSVAHATTFDCDGGSSPVPATHWAGSIEINASGNCTIGHAISADDSITINASGDIDIKTVTSNQGTVRVSGETVTVDGSLSAGVSIQVNASEGATDISGDVNANTFYPHSGGHVLLQADGNVRSGSINLNGASAGGVEIQANTGGGNTLFTVGGTGNSNGVNGTINAAGSDAGGSDPQEVYSGVFITNGDASSTGGITLISASSISVKNTASRAGAIILQANNGTISLPTGKLDADGAAGFGAGQIVLMANTVSTASGTILSASQDSTADPTAHGVWIAARTLTVTGSGAEIITNGDVYSANKTSAILATQDSFHYTSFGDVNFLLWWQDSNNLMYQNAPLTISGSAPLTVRANGADNRAIVTGYPVAVSNHDFTVEAKGGVNNEVLVGYYGSRTGSVGLILDGTGDVIFDASAASAGESGGTVFVYESQATVSAPSVTLQSNGPGSGNGHAGIVNFWTTALTLDPSTKITAKANGGGTGWGGSISFLPGTADFNLGGTTGVQLMANGGNSGGNGGSITSYNAGTITFKSGPGVQAKALGGDGDGGTVTLKPSLGLTIDSSASGASLIVDGEGGGDGGSILMWGGWDDLNLGVSTGELQLSAKSNDTGNGGSIELAYFNTLSVDGTTDASAGQGAGSDGVGGIIDIHDISTLTIVDAILWAKGAGAGSGGVVNLHSNWNTMDLTGASIDASGGDLGLGGMVTVNRVHGFDVNWNINVNPGAVSTSDFAGSISLNGVTCQQWKLAHSWPDAYWNCANPEEPISSDEIPGTAWSNLPNGIPATIGGTKSTFLYVMTSPAQWRTFFAGSLDDKTAGYTFYWASGINPIYTAMFKNTTHPASGYTAMTSNWLQEASVHEAGHILEAINLVEASVDPYLTRVNNDYNHLDAAGAPCSVGGPFQGVVDFQTGQQFCTGTTLNNPGGIYTGLTNSEIAITSSQNLRESSLFGSLGYHEPYAHLFSWVGYGDTLSYPSGYYDTTAGGLIHKGFFQCARQRAATLLGGSYTPSYSCN